MKSEPLTQKQQAIYEFISEEIRQSGYPPTVREIGERFQIKSPNGTCCHLKALEKKGFITRSGNRRRALRILKAEPVTTFIAGAGI